MKNILKHLGVFALVLVTIKANAQDEKKPESNSFFKDRKFNLNEDGSNYVKFTMLAQLWLRSQEYNPGTTIFGIEKAVEPISEYVVLEFKCMGN